MSILSALSHEGMVERSMKEIGIIKGKGGD
jgi:hypothetical protein